VWARRFRPSLISRGSSFYRLWQRRRLRKLEVQVWYCRTSTRTTRAVLSWWTLLSSFLAWLYKWSCQDDMPGGFAKMMTWRKIGNSHEFYANFSFLRPSKSLFIVLKALDDIQTSTTSYIVPNTPSSLGTHPKAFAHPARPLGRKLLVSTFPSETGWCKTYFELVILSVSVSHTRNPDTRFFKGGKVWLRARRKKERVKSNDYSLNGWNGNPGVFKTLITFGIWSSQALIGLQKSPS